MRAGILTIRGSLLNHMLDKQRPRRIEIPEGWRTAAECRWRRKKGPKQRWSGYFSLCPFPSWKGVFSQNGPQRSRARRCCAAKRTLHGEDRSESLDKRERGGPKWTAKMAQSLTASDSLLAGMFQPRNRQSFKERGKAAAGLGPRQFHHAHPVLGALQARRRGMQNSSILTGVQMSPCPLRLMIVERADGAAFGTSPLRLVLMGEVDMHLTLWEFQFDSLHLPRSFNP